MSSGKSKVPGVRVLPTHQQLLISSGTRTLNDLIHPESGIPVGTVFLFREFGGSLQYSSLLLKYFLSQGIHDDHQIFLADPRDASKTLRSLPSFSESKKSSETVIKPEEAKDSEDLLIAWRYKNMQLAPNLKPSESLTFDVKASLSKESLEGRTSSFCPPPEGSESAYVSLLKGIYHVLNDESSPVKFNSSKEDDRPLSILRVVITDFGSLLYGSRDSEDLKRFIISLKSLCRNYLCVVGLQVNGDDEAFYEHIKDHVDSVLDVRAFEEGSNYKKLFKRFHGMIRLEKSSNLHRLNLNPKINSSYLFKSLRNGFSMEIMNLPPDFEVDSSNDNVKNKLGCQSLDF